jgi:DNA-binding CsgD family transcriptional regulator/sugar-specific transcriptional regulator TrmB
MSLGDLGFDPVAERVYQALLNHPEADLEQVVDDAGTPLGETVSALDRLANMALVVWDTERTRPQLVNPDTALAALLAQHESEVARRKLNLEASRQAIDQLLSARRSEAASSVEMVRVLGLDAVLRKIEDLSRTCQTSVWSFNPGGPQSRVNLRRSRPLNEETLERGVRMRALYLDSVRNDDATMEHVAWLVERGAEVRTAPTLPLRMIIVDQLTALVPIDDNDSAKGALVVQGPGVVKAMSALFISVWKTAQPIGPRRFREHGQLNEQERQAILLWAHGHTDRAVASALGVSERTVRRMSEAIAARLGARSRFEAGARAMEVGWLSSGDLI